MLSSHSSHSLRSLIDDDSPGEDLDLSQVYSDEDQSEAIVAQKLAPKKERVIILSDSNAQRRQNLPSNMPSPNDITN